MYFTNLAKKIAGHRMPVMLVVVLIMMSSSCSVSADDNSPDRAQGIYDDNDSYWAQYLPAVNPCLKSDLEIDVAVIGGGYTGLSAAYHIKKSNPALKVVIFEAKRVGNGASGRNGGLVIAQTYSEGGMLFGTNKKYHKEIYDITVASMKRLKVLAESSGIDPEFVLNGQCAGIFDPKNLSVFKEYVAETKRMGMPFEFWDKDKAVSMLGAPNILGAVYDPNGGMVNPAKLVSALKRLAEKEGVIIYDNSPVQSYTEGNTITLSILADNTTRVVKAKSIVIAANAYAAKSLNFLKDDIEPAHTQVAVSEPLTDEEFKILGWKDHISWYDDIYVGKDSSATFHMIITKDHRIIMGGGSVEYNEDDSLLYPGDLNKLRSQIATRFYEIYPALKDVKFGKTWDGIICETKSKGERIGVTGKNKNIYYALGYNGGQGVNVSFLFGELVSKLYNGEKPRLLEIYTK